MSSKQKLKQILHIIVVIAVMLHPVSIFAEESSIDMHVSNQEAIDLDEVEELNISEESNQEEDLDEIVDDENEEENISEESNQEEDLDEIADDESEEGNDSKEMNVGEDTQRATIEVSDADELANAINNATGDITVIVNTTEISLPTSPSIKIPEGVEVTIESASSTIATIRGTARISVAQGGTLNLKNITIRIRTTVLRNATLNMYEGSTFTGINDDLVVNINQGGQFFMFEGSTVSGNTIRSGPTVTSGAVYVEAGATFTMNGGKITGNTGYRGGAGVGVMGTFIMNNGEISNNTGAVVGGVQLTNGATLRMNGGEILNNVNGGILVTGGSSFIMSDGKVSGNVFTSKNGGGIIVSGNGTFVMEGGVIEENEALNGGAISLDVGTLTLNDGVITHNNATLDGGAIFVRDPSLLKTNVTVSEKVWFEGNEASKAYVFMGDAADYPNLQFANTSIGFHILNNYDFSYASDVEVGSGNLRFKEVPESIYFKDIKISNQMTISTRMDDWDLVVSDTRGVNEGWRVTATLDEEFKSNAGHILHDALMYIDQDGNEVLMELGKLIDVFAHIPTDQQDTNIIWEEDKGILLRINPSSYKGNYTGAITWTLVDAL